MKKVTGLSQSVPYIPNSIIMPMAACAKMVGSPMGICPARVKKLQISTNICGKKMASSGYQMKWTFEEALANWYADNKQQCLEKNAFRMSSCIPAWGRVRDSKVRDVVRYQNK